jgi:acid phosphatase
MWLACACTPTFPNAPAGMVAKLDANGRLQRLPATPASALSGPPQYVPSGNTPDGYSVNTAQPPYQPSIVPPIPGGDPRYADPARHPLPPQTAKTLGDMLSTKGVTWAWYAGAWNDALADGTQAPDAKRIVIDNPAQGSPNFQTNHQPYNYFANYAPGTQARELHLRDGAEFLAAIDNGTLPQVAFYKPQGNLNQHPGYADVMAGDEHIAAVVKRIQASKLWPNTAIIVTYDENGGFWDHVAPPKGDRWGPGSRVPAIIISPYAKRGFVDHTQYDTTSIHKFIARRFKLELLPGVRASMGDLTNAFDFSR